MQQELLQEIQGGFLTQQEQEILDRLTATEPTELETSLEASIQELLGAEPNQARINERFIGAREQLAKAERTLLNQARAELANRGLISEPGVPQGPEVLAIQRAGELLAPEFAQAIRDIQIRESELADEMRRAGLAAGTEFVGRRRGDETTRLTAAGTLVGEARDRRLTALQQATGISAANADRLLNTLRSATERQAVLSNIALENLKVNVQWNQFLAQFGLQRDALLNSIRTGNLTGAIAVLQLFLSGLGQARQGFL